MQGRRDRRLGIGFGGLAGLLIWATVLRSAHANDAVLEAVCVGDGDALVGLALSDEPDPWRVADDLLGRGEADVAGLFAAAAPRADVAALPDYVRRARQRSDRDAEARQRIQRANAAASPRDALAALGDGAPDLSTISGVRWAYGRGSALTQVGRVEEALSAYRTAADAAGAIGWLRRQAESLERGGSAAWGAARFVQAEAFYAEALVVEQKRGSPWGIAAREGDVGMARLRAGDLTGARAPLQRSLELARASGFRRVAAVALQNLADLERREGRPADAVAPALEAADILRSFAGVDDLTFAGDVLFGIDRHREALVCYRGALALAEASADTPRRARLLSYIGNTLVPLDDRDRAREALMLSLSVVDEARDPDTAGRCHMSLGLLDLTFGDYSGGAAHAARAAEAYRRSGSEDQRLVALTNLGITSQLIGEIDRAQRVFAEALEISRRVGDPMKESNLLQGIGGLEIARGRTADALRAQEAAVAAGRRSGVRRVIAKALHSLGEVLDLVGRSQEALGTLRQALALLRDGGTHGEVSGVLTDIATVQHGLGDIAGAIETEKEALAEARLGGNRVGEGVILGNIANAEHALGQFDDAIAHHEEALRVFAETRSDANEVRETANTAWTHLRAGHLAVAAQTAARAAEMAEVVARPFESRGAYSVLASVRAAEGRWADVVRAVRRSLDADETVSSGLGEESQGYVRGAVWGLFVLGAESALALGQHDVACELLERGRAGSLLEAMGGRRALREVVLPAALRSEESEAMAVESRAVAEHARALRRGDLGEIRARRAGLDESRTRLAAVVEKVQREAKAAAGVAYPRPAALAEIQTELGGGEALVLYGLGADDALALVLTRGAIRSVDLGKASEVEAAVGRMVLSDLAVDPEAALADARARFVVPLALPPEIHRVLVSPDGPMSQVPFPALLPDREVVMVPSGTTWLFLRQEEAEKGEAILALGDPERAPSERLPGTRAEATAVGDVVLLGKAATKEGFLDALSKRLRWHAVHLACHGRIDPERPLFSSLALTPSADGDGLLRTLDVLGTRIPADLAVLSACDSGTGKIVRGEGIVGLTRAFMYAGAPRVLCSLWKVEDAATLALMTKFYERWRAGASAAGALHEAQEFVRSQEKWRHPSYWAAWVLWGLP